MSADAKLSYVDGASNELGLCQRGQGAVAVRVEGCHRTGGLAPSLIQAVDERLGVVQGQPRRISSACRRASDGLKRGCGPLDQVQRRDSAGIRSHVQEGGGRRSSQQPCCCGEHTLPHADS